MNDLSTLPLQQVWKHFSSLCAIPHPSKHEQKVSEFVQQFAADRGLKCVVDKVGNVIIFKPATPGMEKRKTIVLQAHLDMVPQKNADTVHDFKADPIKAYVDGDWVTAEGTTLGADNGIGVAAILGVLDAGENLPHPPLEALLTIDEETGMTGAFGLEPGLLQGEILLNLDSEDEGQLYIGCAGGIDCTGTLSYQEESLNEAHKALKISVKGLKGGHSGLDISLGRGNANKVMNRLLLQLHQQVGVRLGKLTGGSLRNAIPRESFAEVAVPETSFDAAQALIRKLEKEIAQELKVTEPDFTVVLEEKELLDKYVDAETALRFYRLVSACPNGVIRMSDSIPGLTETSLNVAVITVKNKTIKIKCLLRSSVDSAKYDLAEMVSNTFLLAGAEVETAGDYPGWKPNPNSEILEIMKGVYQHKYGKVPEVKAIHAGLECGLLGGVYPNWDMISFGPTICFPHSPDEKVHIESVNKFWDLLGSTLKRIPNK